MRSPYILPLAGLAGCVLAHPRRGAEEVPPSKMSAYNRRAVATGTSSASPSSTSSANPNCELPSYPYTCYVCNATTNNPFDNSGAWAASDANGALSNIVGWYGVAVDAGMVPNDHNLVQGMSAFWDGPPGQACDLKGGQCIVPPGGCASVKSPGAFQVMQGTVDFWQSANGMYQALLNAAGPVSDNMGDFQQTFAPAKQDNSLEIMKEILDIVAIGYGQIAAFGWNKILKEAFKDAKNHGWAKDAANSAVTTGVTFAKDSFQALQDALKNENDLRKLSGQWVTGMQDTIEAWWLDMISGSRGGSDTFNATMQNGVFSGNPLTNVTMEQMRDYCSVILYSQLLVPAWNMVPTGEHGMYPAIVTQPGSCNQTNPFDWIGPDDQDDISVSPKRQSGPMYSDHTWAPSDADAKKSRICPPDSDTTYYVLGAGFGSPDQVVIQALPGVEQLNGTNWGGITIQNIWNSSYMGYQINGNKNGYVMPMGSMAIDGANTTGDTVFQNGIETPGWWSLPICNASEWAGTALDTEKSGVDPTKNECPFPCCGKFL